MKKLTEIFGIHEAPLDRPDDRRRGEFDLGRLFGRKAGSGPLSTGVPEPLPTGLRKGPPGAVGQSMTVPVQMDPTQRMQRSMDNDVTGRYARGSQGTRLGSPQDEPLPDLPLEGQFDDLNKQLGSAQSVFGGGARSARVGQGDQVQRRQADLDQSKSVRREAFGSDAADIKRQLSSGKMDTYSCISRAVKLAGSGKDPVEVASALHDLLYGEGSQPKPVQGGSEMGSGSSTMTSRAVGGLKLQ